jgi:hypothetical protein
MSAAHPNVNLATSFLRRELSFAGDTRTDADNNCRSTRSDEKRRSFMRDEIYAVMFDE